MPKINTNKYKKNQKWIFGQNMDFWNSVDSQTDCSALLLMLLNPIWKDAIILHPSKAWKTVHLTCFRLLLGCSDRRGRGTKNRRWTKFRLGLGFPYSVT